MADDYGYVKLHRKIRKNPVWNVKPFSKGQAWVDMIMSANHEPAQLVYGNEIIDLQRGQFHTSELKLAEEWGWSRKKVRAYLLLLKNLKMATTEATKKGTTITIENYNDYQCDGTTEGTTQGTFKEPRRNHEGYINKNEKNDKNEKEDIYSDLPVELHGPLKKYIEMRKGMGKQKAMSERAIELLIVKLNKLAPCNTELQISMLEEATVKNWLSVYLPKNQDGAPTDQQKQATAEKKRQAEQEADAIIEKERQELLKNKTPQGGIKLGDLFKLPV